MSNVMSLKSLRNNVHRNGFDLSRKNAFTAKCGELLPVVVQECIPGDKFNISNEWFTRTQPVNSAAFTRIREYYDVYFVPNRLLWRDFPQFITQMNDPKFASTINTPVALKDQHPYFLIVDLIDYLKRLSSTSDSQKNNFFGFDRVELTVKLLSYLGYGDYSAFNSFPVLDETNVALNPFPLLAYQKIYQDYFRDSQWERAAPYTYNIDYVGTSSYNSLVLPLERTTFVNPTLLDLRYCNWNKDYFMGMLPEAQFGDTAVASPLEGSLRGDITVQFDQQSVTPTMTGDASLNLSSKNGAYNAGLSVLALRQAEFLQKWKEIAQSGDKDYKSQMKKHFNVDVPDTLSNKCRYLGGWSSNLDINEVVNQNLASDGSDADILGKGVGSGRGSVNFDCNEHGVLMVLYHCVPLLDYEATGVHRLNLKSFATDYAIPEFDSVGMQSLPLIELDFSPSTAIIHKIGSQLGYVPRYCDYKTSIDEVRGAFVKSMKHWVSPITGLYLREYFSKIAENAGDGPLKISYEFFKVNPSLLDSIFVVNADSTVDTDQFSVNSFFDIKAVRNLDYNGLPY